MVCESNQKLHVNWNKNCFKFLFEVFWNIVRGNDSFYRRFQRICNFGEKIIPNEKKFDLASFYYYCFGISSDYFYFFICKVKVQKCLSIFQAPFRQVQPFVIGERDRPWIAGIVFHNLERKTVPVEEPNYHLSIEPVRCPDKTKEKFILFYTPIAANATRVRNRATTTRSLS